MSFFCKLSFIREKIYNLISLINVESTLTDFDKFHPPQKEYPASTFIDFINIFHPPRLFKPPRLHYSVIMGVIITLFSPYVLRWFLKKKKNPPSTQKSILQVYWFFKKKSNLHGYSNLHVYWFYIFLHPLHVYSNLHVYWRDESTRGPRISWFHNSWSSQIRDIFQALFSWIPPKFMRNKNIKRIHYKRFAQN